MKTSARNVFHCTVTDVRRAIFDLHTGGAALALAHTVDQLADMVQQVAEWGYQYIEQSPHPQINPFYKHPKAGREVIAEYKKALRDTGVSILLVEQNARAALEVADYGYVLEMGTISLHGPARELAHDARVIDTYLGAASTPA